MVAVGFAVGRAMDELGPVAINGKPGCQAGYEVLAAIEGVLEGYGSRDRPVIEEQGECSPSRAAPEIRPAGVNVVVDFFPMLGADLPDPPGLVGSQNREFHPGFGENLERLVVDSGLRQPHPLGFALEPFAEILLPPSDL